MDRFALGLGIAIAAVFPAFAQFTPPGTIRITSNFSMSQSVKADDVTAIDAAEEQGRKIIYQRAAQECKLLLDTLASTCKLETLNVFANVQNRSFRADSSNVDVNTTGNAQYWVTPRN